ncbi:MAG TPA: nucleotide exchange factor GrpE [bacterium]|nr:nucleotide exchange factor GrpE [bacterium]
MSKKKKPVAPPPAGNESVIELDENAASAGMSLQEIADALGKQMMQGKEEEQEAPEPEKGPGTPTVAPAKEAPVAPQNEETSKKIKELEAEVIRLVAENRNQKGRLENEFRTRLKFATEDFFRDFIVVKDDMEKALTFVPDTGDEKVAAFADGIRHLNANIEALLRRFGVESFDAIGTPFDPHLHQAMRMVDVAGRPAQEVVAQHLKGYRYCERVLRPAMVDVASGNAPAEEKPVEAPQDIPTPNNDTEESHG